MRRSVMFASLLAALVMALGATAAVQASDDDNKPSTQASCVTSSNEGENDNQEGVDEHGTANDDHLSGSKANDRLDGDDGDDVLDGNHGDDDIQGGAGDDDICGDDGNDHPTAAPVPTTSAAARARTRSTATTATTI